MSSGPIRLCSASMIGSHSSSLCGPTSALVTVWYFSPRKYSDASQAGTGGSHHWRAYQSSASRLAGW